MGTRRLAALQEVQAGGHTAEWFEQQDEGRAEATRELLALGLIERVEDQPSDPPRAYRLTDAGTAFWSYVTELIGTASGIDLARSDEIEFPDGIPS